MHQVLLVEPQELFGVEGRGRLVHIGDVERGDHLGAREHLLVAMRPAEAHEVVEQRVGQVAVLLVLQHAHRAVALGELGAVRPEDHRHMRVDRDLRAERGEHVHLSRRVVEMIVAADDMRDAHVGVVHHHAEVVGRRTVAARDHEVVELAVAEHHAPVHEVLHHHLALERVAEADHRIDAGPRVGAVAPAAVVARLLLARHLLGAQLLELFLGAVAAVSLALGEPLRDHFLVAWEARRLEIRALVVREAEPLHALEDHPHRLVRRALTVGVLDAQDELAAVPAGVQPGKEGRADAADVQHAGRARGETGDDAHGGRSLAQPPRPS